MKKTQKRREIGQFVVADPDICHGQLTIRGTRILVGDVLDYLAAGKDWNWICRAFDGKVTPGAIAEIVRLGGEALIPCEADSSPGTTRWEFPTSRDAL